MHFNSMHKKDQAGSVSSACCSSSIIIWWNIVTWLDREGRKRSLFEKPTKTWASQFRDEETLLGDEMRWKCVKNMGKYVVNMARVWGSTLRCCWWCPLCEESNQSFQIMFPSFPSFRLSFERNVNKEWIKCGGCEWSAPDLSRRPLVC